MSEIDGTGRTWYVVLPFATEASARRAYRQIQEDCDFIGVVGSAIEDDLSGVTP